MVTILHALARPFRQGEKTAWCILDANGQIVCDCFGDTPLAEKLVEILNGRALTAQEIFSVEAALDGAESFMSGFEDDETQEEPVGPMIDAIQKALTILSGARFIGSEPEAPKE